MQRSRGLEVVECIVAMTWGVGTCVSGAIMWQV